MAPNVLPAALAFSGAQMAAARRTANNRIGTSVTKDSSNSSPIARQTALPEVHEGVKLTDLRLDRTAAAALGVALPQSQNAAPKAAHKFYTLAWPAVLKGNTLWDTRPFFDAVDRVGPLLTKNRL